MAQAMTFVFSGMCAFQVAKADGLAVMLSENGEHIPTLAIPTNKCIDPVATTWKPDAIAEVMDSTGKFVQVAIWNLKGQTISASDVAPAAITWDKTDLIDFQTYHPKATTLDVGSIVLKDRNVSLFRFTGGQLSYAKDSVATICQENHKDVDKNVVAKTKWTVSLAEISNSAGAVIRFSGPGTCMVSNIAAVPADEGSKHVQHYYDILTVPAGTDKLTAVKDKDTTTYDCIRPVAVP